MVLYFSIGMKGLAGWGLEERNFKKKKKKRVWYFFRRRSNEGFDEFVVFFAQYEVSIDVLLGE